MNATKVLKKKWKKFDRWFWKQEFETRAQLGLLIAMTVVMVTVALCSMAGLWLMGF